MWESIISTISNLIKILGDVCSILINNKLFLILLGIVILSILIGIVFTLVCRIKNSNSSKVENNYKLLNYIDRKNRDYDFEEYDDLERYDNLEDYDELESYDNLEEDDELFDVINSYKNSLKKHFGK